MNQSMNVKQTLIQSYTDTGKKLFNNLIYL